MRPHRNLLIVAIFSVRMVHNILDNSHHMYYVDNGRPFYSGFSDEVYHMIPHDLREEKQNEPHSFIQKKTE